MVIVLYYHEDLTFKEIGEVLEVCTCGGIEQAFLEDRHLVAVAQVPERFRLDGVCLEPQVHDPEQENHDDDDKK